MGTRMERVSQRAFEKMAAEAFERLPGRFREKVKNLAILVEDVPDRRTARELKLRSPLELLGLYRGVPQTARHNDASFTLPDTVTLYRRAIEAHAAHDGMPLRDAIYETLWHEIGHHFGLDEHGVRTRERERFRRGKRSR